MFSLVGTLREVDPVYLDEPPVLYFKSPEMAEKTGDMAIENNYYTSYEVWSPDDELCISRKFINGRLVKTLYKTVLDSLKKVTKN